MPKRSRIDAAKKGWKKRKSSLMNTDGRVVKKRKLWEDKSMIAAIEAVTGNKMGVNRAALEYGVPKTTLKDRIAGRVIHGKKPGRVGYLTQEEEQELVDFLTESCKLGYGKTRREVINIVKRVVEKKKKDKENSQCNVKFNGEGWWNKFMERHPKLSLRASDSLSQSRANAVNQDSIDHYYSLLKRQLEESNLKDKACYIYNMDETGIPFDHKQLKRVAPKGLKKVYGLSSGNKYQITVLACANAAGTVLPPMVIFKGERLNHEWTKGEVPNTIYGMSPQGWIDHELFNEWLQKLFIENIPQTRPVILLLDGHSSHYTPEAIKTAAENEIILFCLPPHATHVAQPLDVSFFGPLKKHWFQVCHTYMAENPGKVVTKFLFSSLFNEAWFKSIQPQSIVSGFKKVGICPYNAMAIKFYATASLETTSQQSDDNQRKYGALNSSVSSCDSQENIKDFEEHISDVSFTEDQITLFQQRFDNGYDLYHDSMYVAWLQQEHPEALPSSSSFNDSMELQNSSYADEAMEFQSQDASTSKVCVLSEVSDPSTEAEKPSDIHVTSNSVSKSLEFYCHNYQNF